MVATTGLLAEVYEEAQRHHDAQRFAEAQRLYRRVVDADPSHRGAWHHLGIVCKAQNNLRDAAECFERVLELVPNQVDAITQLGIVYARQNRVPEAIARFRRAIELRPDYAKAHNNLGVALSQTGKKDDGFACYREAVRLEPGYAEAQVNLAVALADRKQISEAIAAYEHALRARPDYVDALFSLGMLLVNERRIAEGVVLLEQAVRLKPDSAEVQNNLALALAVLGRFEESVASCDASLRLRPLDPKTHMNRGNALSSLGRMQEAIACYDYALRLQPDYIQALWNRSLALLSEGDLFRGFPEYEIRWKRPETKTRQIPRPQWDGGSLEGKIIFLWCEQGIGDTLQFIRYARILKERGATVWQECAEHLIPLLSTCSDVDRFFAEGTGVPIQFHCHSPLMSLPSFCGTTLATIPAQVPYLSADANRVEHWRNEMAHVPGLKIGITWQGNPGHRWDHHRSFSIQWFRDLAMLDDVSVFSLQKGLGTENLPNARFPVKDLRPALDEQGGGLEQTAAAIQSLDLVIACDSAVAHLAGALGKTVWVPRSALADWRWIRNREDSPRYPTKRLFRQRKLGDWQPVFARICDEVKALGLATAAARAQPSSKITDSWATLLAIRERARVQGKKVVWTNGCFDLLHAGHARNLQAARRHGDILVVGVNSDASVRRLKGSGRPVVAAEERMELIASLACVDHVIEFDEDTPVEAINRLKPDVHCKGADYAPPSGKPIPEAEVISAYGGRIEFLPMVPGQSSSDLIERIHANQASANPNRQK
jgi:rfaE bifunctional protein nucleotidyltransferase chain/domain